MACNVRILILFWAILSIYVGACILYSNAFWFCNNMLLYGEKKKGAVSCLYRTDDRTGHCKFRLDCRTKKKAKDGPLALPVHKTLDKVRVFPVSIPPEDLPSKKTWHLAMMMTWVRELCGLQVLHRVNWLCFPSFYSNIYALISMVEQLISQDILGLQQQGLVLDFTTLPVSDTVARQSCAKHL